MESDRILRKSEIATIEALTEPEAFHMEGFAPLVAFQTSGRTSTLPETFEGKVGDCFEETLRYPVYYDLLCKLKELPPVLQGNNEVWRCGNRAPRTHVKKYSKQIRGDKVPTSASWVSKPTNPLEFPDCAACQAENSKAA